MAHVGLREVLPLVVTPALLFFILFIDYDYCFEVFLNHILPSVV